MKRIVPCAVTLCLLSMCLTVSGCKSFSRKESLDLFPGLVQAPATPAAAAALFAELGGEPAFLDLVRYLYRWYLDEDDFKHFNREHKGQLWIRSVQTVVDLEDDSRYLEVVFPATGVTVTLKKTRYRIAELKLDVKSDGYRIIGVCRDTGWQAARPGDYAILDLDVDALYERLFQMRLETRLPGEALQAHAQNRIVQQCDLLPESQRGKPKTLYFAPVEAIDNELWAFWEEGKLLFKFSSDADLANPEVWTQDTLEVTVFDTVAQTVVSYEESPGDNRFLTRDQVGRALYNCIVLGKKRVTP